MLLNAWSGALAGLAYSLFAIHLLQLGFAREGKAWGKTTLFAAVLLSALWGWAAWGWAVSGTSALLWLGLLSDLARNAAWLAFLLHWMQADESGRKPLGMGWMAPAAGTLVVLQLLALALAHTGPQPWAWGDPARLLALTQLGLPVLALVTLEQVFSNVREDTRWGIKPLCLGLLGLFVFDLYLYAQAVLFKQPDADALAIRGVVHAAVVPLLALSVMRRKDWLAQVRLSPRAAFHSAALLAAGLYLLFLSGVGYYVRYFGGEWGRALQQALVFLGMVGLLVLLFSGSARARLRVLLGKHLFRYRFDYREEWLRFTHTLSERSTDTEVGQHIIRGLADMLESPSGALWTRSRGDASFCQSARWNQSPVLQHEDSTSPLCAFLARSGWIINLQEYHADPQRYDHLALPLWLRDAQPAWLIIPLMVDQTLIAFCVLDNARTPVEVDWEVKDLLKTAGQQAASFLAQAQATEALLEARKFEAFNRMSAFVAHDLKNIVTQLSLMLKNARRLGDNPEFQQDMLMTIEHALERMRHMLLQLRREPDVHEVCVPGGVDLVAVLQRIAEQCRRTRGQQLELQGSAPLQVRGHGERLERVLGHMVHNALDAIEGGGRAWAQIGRHGDQAHICIGDTGQGMSASFLQDRLFKPFQSTKPAGMGIGAFESLQYVQELGGSIAVDSTEGRGTLVTLQLPLFEEPVAIPAARFAK